MGKKTKVNVFVFLIAFVVFLSIYALSLQPVNQVIYNKIVLVGAWYDDMGRIEFYDRLMIYNGTTHDILETKFLNSPSWGKTSLWYQSGDYLYFRRFHINGTIEQCFLTLTDEMYDSHLDIFLPQYNDFMWERLT